jgi:predicted metal-dependent hydrolase
VRRIVPPNVIKNRLFVTGTYPYSGCLLLTPGESLLDQYFAEPTIVWNLAKAATSRRRAVSSSAAIAANLAAGGSRLLLQIIETNVVPAVELKHGKMVLRVRRSTSAAKRQTPVDEWYRAELQKAVPPLVARWVQRLGVRVKRFFV